MASLLYRMFVAPFRPRAKRTGYNLGPVVDMDSFRSSAVDSDDRFHQWLRDIYIPFTMDRSELRMVKRLHLHTVGQTWILDGEGLGYMPRKISPDCLRRARSMGMRIWLMEGTLGVWCFHRFE